MGNRKRNAPRVMEDTGTGRIFAAFASLGAAGIHLASAADHYNEWWLAGVFFYAVAVFQAGWAMTLLRVPGRFPMLVGLAANAGIVATWVVSRTTGIPAGPHAGEPESMGRAGITAVALEVLICLAAIGHSRRHSTRGFATSLRAAVVMGTASAAVVAATLPAVQAAAGHGHGSAEESAPHGHQGEEEQHHSPAPEPSSPEPTGSRSSTSPESPQPSDPEHGDTPHEH